MKKMHGGIQIFKASARVFPVLVVLMTMLATRASAFTLVGPYTEWMYPSNGYHGYYEIGGPMDLGEEYRWNVPVVTYGFDKSFRDYFGPYGVVVVESAIQAFNDLPDASNIDLGQYPLNTQQNNYFAAGGNFYDLKSTALALLFEQMGLTRPTDNIFDIRRWSPLFIPPSEALCTEVCFSNWAYPDYIIQRNFDPETLAASHFVNGVLYTGYIYYAPGQLTTLYEVPVDPVSELNPAVGEALGGVLSPGVFYTGLTRDDVGGLRYLLSRTNINYENLLPGIYRQKQRGRSPQLVKGAWRPGVEKIQFVPQPTDKNGRFKSTELEYTDTYFTNGIAVDQPVRRIVHRPDILFSASYLGGALFARSGTGGWMNNAARNGKPSTEGPGVIRPPVTITFGEVGAAASTHMNAQPFIFISYDGWASFDASQGLAVYPAATRANASQCSVHLNAYVGTNSLTRTWRLKVGTGEPVALRISTNRTEWVTLTTVTNTTGIIDWFYAGVANPSIRFDPAPVRR